MAAVVLSDQLDLAKPRYRFVWDRPKPVPFTNSDRFLISHTPEFDRGGWTFTVQGKKSPSFLISPHPSPQINPHTLNLEHGLGYGTLFRWVLSGAKSQQIGLQSGRKLANQTRQTRKTSHSHF